MEDFLVSSHHELADATFEAGISRTERKRRLQTWLDAITAEGYNATIDAPLCFVADLISELQPQAPVPGSLNPQSTPRLRCRASQLCSGAFKPEGQLRAMGTEHDGFI